MSANFAKLLLPYILRIICSKEYEEEDPDQWTPYMAASTCLALVSERLQNDIFVDNILVGFIETNISDARWNFREAAIMVFGSLISNPDRHELGKLAHPILPLLLNALKDPSVSVRDASSWVLGRISEVVSSVLFEQEVRSIYSHLLSIINDVPRVASNACWSIMNLVVQTSDAEDDSIRRTTSFFAPQIISALLKSAARADGDEFNLRTASFEALSNVVLFVPQDCMDHVYELHRLLITELKAVVGQQSPFGRFHSGMINITQVAAFVYFRAASKRSDATALLPSLPIRCRH